jgi:D-beta-D-heptose 7-phosphate kinase / D-beta-D-heptose 1-phosphate adenosyltransferase
MNDWDTSWKIATLSDLLAVLDYRRVRGGRIVLTCGCFDLLHAGHLELLQFARGQGDALVVAMNSDASVRQLKGLGRPIVAEAQRARLLSGLECVDFVTIFDTPTAVALIQAVHPAIWVKGGDTVPLAAEIVALTACGARVEYAPVVTDTSTTQLVRSLHHGNSGQFDRQTDDRQRPAMAS